VYKVLAKDFILLYPNIRKSYVNWHTIILLFKPLTSPTMCGNIYIDIFITKNKKEELRNAVVTV